MGSTLGKLWSQSGHDILYSSRHPEELAELVNGTPRSKAVTIDVAARDGEALFLGVPYAAMPELSKTLGPLVKGKLVLDAGNVMASRDGALEQAAALVRDAGQEPVILPGGVAASARIDFGSPVWNTNMTASQVRAALGL